MRKQPMCSDKPSWLHQWALKKKNSNAREINSLPNSNRAVAGSTYRHFWHRKKDREPQTRQSGIKACLVGRKLIEQCRVGRTAHCLRPVGVGPSRRRAPQKPLQPGAYRHRVVRRPGALLTKTRIRRKTGHAATKSCAWSLLSLRSSHAPSSRYRRWRHSVHAERSRSIRSAPALSATVFGDLGLGDVPIGNDLSNCQT